MEMNPPKGSLPPYHQPGAYPQPMAPPQPLHEQDGRLLYPQQGVPQYTEMGIPVYNQNFPGQNQGSSTPGEWSTGLCGCCEDTSNCCITCCCPCITFGQIAEVVDKGSTPCVVAGAIYGLILAFIGCPCLYSCSYRTKIRNLYSLKEGPCNDFCVHCCCECCAVCQEFRELRIRGVEPLIGWQGNVDKWNRGNSTMQPAVPPGMYR